MIRKKSNMKTLLRLTPGTDAVHCMSIHTDIITKEDFRERFTRWCVDEDYMEQSVDDFLWLEVKDMQEAYKITDEVDSWDDEKVESFEKEFVTFSNINW